MATLFSIVPGGESVEWVGGLIYLYRSGRIQCPGYPLRVKELLISLR